MDIWAALVRGSFSSLLPGVIHPHLDHTSTANTHGVKMCSKTCRETMLGGKAVDDNPGPSSSTSPGVSPSPGAPTVHLFTHTGPGLSLLSSGEAQGGG